jgi:hypothetical protein
MFHFAVSVFPNNSALAIRAIAFKNTQIGIVFIANFCCGFLQIVRQFVAISPGFWASLR